MASCLRLFWQVAMLAASRTFCTAGTSRPIRMAMMAMTTSSSISVNAVRLCECGLMFASHEDGGKKDKCGRGRQPSRAGSFPGDQPGEFVVAGGHDAPDG